MKPGFHIAMATLALAVTPVLAGDIVQLTQTGRWNNAVIEQIASNGNNLIQVRQVEDAWRTDDGNIANNALLTQHAVGNSTIDVHQDSLSMDASVRQHDGSDLQAVVASSSYTMGHSSTIEQSGQGARASIEQRGSASLADIVQHGWGGGNLAEIRQLGDAHRATIQQDGSGLNATITQSGAFPFPYFNVGNFATIRQSH